jgi:hypothetical protein
VSVGIRVEEVKYDNNLNVDLVQGRELLCTSCVEDFELRWKLDLSKNTVTRTKKREMEKNDGRSMMANKKDAGTGRTLCNNGIAAGGRTEDSSPSTIIGR